MNSELVKQVNMFIKDKQSRYTQNVLRKELSKMFTIILRTGFKSCIHVNQYNTDNPYITICPEGILNDYDIIQVLVNKYEHITDEKIKDKVKKMFKFICKLEHIEKETVGVLQGIFDLL